MASSTRRVPKASSYGNALVSPVHVSNGTVQPVPLSGRVPPSPENVEANGRLVTLSDHLVRKTSSSAHVWTVEHVEKRGVE